MVDSPRRDLRWRIYMAANLSKYGITSIIGQRDYILPTHDNSKKAIWLGRFISNNGKVPGDKLLFETFKRNKTPVFFIHDEGGFHIKKYYNNTITERIHPIDIMKEDFIKKVYVWGEEQKKILLDKARKELKEKITISGSPKFEILENAEVGDEKWILACTPFKVCNPGSQGIKPFSERAIDLAKDDTAGSMNEAHWHHLRYWKKTTDEFSEFIEMIDQLSTKLPNENIVIRPHPDENADYYKGLFSHRKNIEINSSGDAFYLIRNSKAVIHTESTTGLEALLCGKKTINFRPLGEHDYVMLGLETAGTSAGNINEVLTCLQDEHPSKDISNNKYINLNTNSLEKITDDLVSFINKNKVKSRCLIQNPEAEAPKEFDTKGKNYPYSIKEIETYLNEANQKLNTAATIEQQGFNHVIIKQKTIAREQIE
ncbi:surface carbohydrate biosynthesis protein [Marinospirillum celere]|nr:surface carbohydrate biosynthesis protein [Marinospirillum celere]